MTFIAGFLNGLIKKINEQKCESSSRSTSESQLLAITAISQDFVMGMYENQACIMREMYEKASRIK